MNDVYTKSLIHGEAVVVGGDEPNEREPGRVSFRVGADGAMTLCDDGGEARFDDIDGSKQAAAEARLSPALARLEKARAGRTSLIEAFEIDGETWYLLRMNQKQISQVAIRMRELGDGSLSMGTPDNFQAMIAATVQVGVVKGPRDVGQYFDPAPQTIEDTYGNPTVTTELEQWMNEPGLDVVVSNLFDRLTDINPTLWPKKKAALALAREAALG